MASGAGQSQVPRPRPEGAVQWPRARGSPCGPLLTQSLQEANSCGLLHSMCVAQAIGDLPVASIAFIWPRARKVPHTNVISRA